MHSVVKDAMQSLVLNDARPITNQEISARNQFIPPKHNQGCTIKSQSANTGMCLPAVATVTQKTMTDEKP
jgi:hypothetical protein